MRIACIGYLEGAGGAEKQIINLANEMASRGHNVMLVVLASNVEMFPINHDVKIIDTTINEKNSSFKLIYRYKELKRVLKAFSPDITVNFWLQSAYLTATMPKTIVGKVIYAERGDPGDDEYHGLLGIIRNIAFHNIEGFVFQTEGARNYFTTIDKKKTEIIHNPVHIKDDRFSAPCKNREKKIVNIGRLHPQKNQKLLIKAFAEVAKKHPDYRLEIYGDGDLRESLESEIRQLELENSVSILHSCKNVFEKMYTSSVFVLSSDFEGMPNVLMEAMAMGIPCISTDCKPGGARALIDNGTNGWIVPIDNMQALSKQICYVLDNPQEAKKIAIKAMDIRENHHPKEIYNKWESFFHRILEN